MQKIKTIAHDGTMFVVGDMMHVGDHVIHPFVRHDHGCLLCRTQHNRRRRSNLEHMLAIPASSDLDLASTNSDCVRHLVVFGLDHIKTSETQNVLRFVQDLALHSGYNISFGYGLKPEKYHVFTCLIVDSCFPRDNDLNHDLLKTWLRTIVSTKSTRAVLVIPQELTTFMNQVFASDEDGDKMFAKTTILYYKSLSQIIDVLLHMSLVTKYRMTVNNLSQMSDDVCVIGGSVNRDQCLFF